MAGRDAAMRHNIVNQASASSKFQASNATYILGSINEN